MSYLVGQLPPLPQLPMPQLPSGLQLTTTGAVQAVSRAQGYLSQLGLYGGAVNGIWDGATKNALATFRAQMGLPGSVGVNQADLAALSQAVDYKNALAQQAAQNAADQGVPIPGVTTPIAIPSSVLDSLPSWALPVGAGLGAFLLWKVVSK